MRLRKQQRVFKARVSGGQMSSASSPKRFEYNACLTVKIKRDNLSLLKKERFSLLCY
jgi:hypothetical protein